jgi:hypothetical protein
MNLIIREKRIRKLTYFKKNGQVGSAIALPYHAICLNIVNNSLKKRLSFLILVLLVQNIVLSAQNPVRDSFPVLQDSLMNRIDTLPPAADSMVAPSVIDTINLSSDALEARVEYQARDSMISDISGQRLYLYGDASVKYQDLSLQAAYIMLDLEKSEVLAQYMLDSLGKKIGVPAFSQGEQNFTAYRMRYNFESGKGKVFDITTNQNDVVVKGRELKFITEQGEQDTAKSYIFYDKNAIFTTCTADDPHFGVRSGKQKVINDKLIVVGPSNLEIMGVPTPVVLPFGFFPMTKGRRTGLLFPRDYEYSRQWGFGLRDIGWFFPLGDHINLTMRTDIYLKGTWGIKANSQYNKRYAYSGNFRFGYDSRRSESNEGIVTRQNSISLSWSHQQAAAAHPTNKFGGSINMQFLGNYQSLVNNQAEFVLNNTLNSNFGFSKRWRDKPYNLNITLSHTQNTRSNLMNVTLPVVRFSTGTLYPFERKSGGGEKKWYENIVVRYTGEGRNQLTGQADSFFQARTLETAKIGVRHDVQASTSFKLLKYFSLNPSINYEEVWNVKRVNKRFDPTPQVKVDTIRDDDGILPDQFVRDTLSYGQVLGDTIWSWAPYRQYSFSMGLTTQIFGTLRFRGNGLKGIRHTIKPSISFSYSPNYLSDNLGYYREVQTDSRFPDQTQRYSIFEDGVFGSPPQSGERMSLNFSFRNIVEAKYFSRKDSTDKKLKIFDNLNISGNYNFAADSLKFSQVRLSGATRFFKGTTTLRFNATYDPYVENENGRRINRFAINESGKLLRFVSANVGIATNLTVAKIRALFQGREEPLDEGQRVSSGPSDGPPGAAQARQEREEDLLSLLENFSINHNISFRWDKAPDGTTEFRTTTNSLNLRGSIRMTKNWDINIGNIGYDFSRKDITYPSVGFSRDLHCWEMGLDWQPTRGTYSFYIRVKPGTLDFIRLPYQQNNADALRAF